MWKCLRCLRAGLRHVRYSCNWRFTKPHACSFLTAFCFHTERTVQFIGQNLCLLKQQILDFSQVKVAAQYRFTTLVKLCTCNGSSSFHMALILGRFKSSMDHSIEHALIPVHLLDKAEVQGTESLTAPVVLLRGCVSRHHPSTFACLYVLYFWAYICKDSMSFTQ